MRNWIALLLAALCGCTLADVKVEVVSERTTLENQVLGAYNALDREMLLAASVRGVDARGEIRKPPRHSQEHRDAITALQVLAFHADDLQAFKRLGWVGENNEGLLTSFDMKAALPPPDLAEFAARYTGEEFEAVVSRCNEAREVVMRRVIETSEHLSEEQLPEVRRIFGRLNVENALPGEKIQGPGGDWRVQG